MCEGKIAPLDDRGVVGVSGADAEKLLQGLITNDMGELDDEPAIHAGLLSPQGKILFEFFVVKSEIGFLLEVERDKAADLVKRLTIYKLRANVAISDVSNDYGVFAVWGLDRLVSAPGINFADPRLPELSNRLLLKSAQSAAVLADVAKSQANWKIASKPDYVRRRIAKGVPEGGKDYDFADAYPHEADFDVFNGVSFTKGCYVGQEIVARMQHKTVVRKRVVPVIADAALPESRPEVVADGVPVGRLGSVAGTRGLALLRLDRAADALASGHPLSADSVILRIDPPTWLVMPEAGAKPQT